MPTTHLTYDGNDDVWQGTFTVPAGSYEYKAALNDSWDENYGANAQANGPNIMLSVAAEQPVKFYYDHKTHWITSNRNATIATVAGSFQSELGCPGDWQPDCLRSWLQDPDGDGTYTFESSALPAGSYEAKVAINEAWDENYGAGGAPNGDNITFTVPTGNTPVRFTYNAITHILNISSSSAHAHDNNVEYDGLAHDSQHDVYRTPFGAVNPGVPVTLRFRTFHDDVTGVRARFYDSATQQQFFRAMTPAATDIGCYGGLPPTERCDFWTTTITPTQISTLYYRFIVTDGTATAFYADDAFH